MYWIALVVAIGFLVMFVLAGKQVPPPDTASLLKPFYKIALYLYKKLWNRIPGVFSSTQVERDLVNLHPGEAREYLKTEYYGKKTAICLAILFVGTVFGAAAKFSAMGEIVLREMGQWPGAATERGLRKSTLRQITDSSRWVFRWRWSQSG